MPLLQLIAVRHAQVEMDCVTLAEHNVLVVYCNNQSPLEDVDELCTGMLMQIRRFRSCWKFSEVDIDLTIPDIEIQTFEEV